ncbi:MAG: glycosyltransferase family 4 protein [Myxococcales bacterium]|nr:glycosyltransferase family 4 protein [Myxococcales bacterium]
MTAPPSALFIAYHYPPRGGVAVLRTIKFLKYLHRFGWRLKVLTLKTQRYVVTDDTLGAEVPDSVDIVRLPDPGPAISKAALALTRKRFAARGFPDVESWWVPAAAAAAVDAVVRGRIPVIYTTSPPHSTHLVGEWCKRLTGVRWVADFRDTWADNPYFVEPAGWRRRWKERLERRVVETADVILANTPQALDAFVARYPAHAEKFVWLPNGYDDDDFVTVPAPRPTPHPLTLMYVGSAGGTRPLDHFFAALDELRRAGAPGAADLEVVFVGPISVKVQRQVEALGLGAQVRFTGQLPHAEAVAEMYNCDVLLLLQFADHGGSTALPSKVFEYMKARKVIFGMTCEGPTSELIRQYPAGFVTAPDDVPAIREVLARLLDLHRRGALPTVDDDGDHIERFSREALTRQLHDIMIGLLTVEEQSEHSDPGRRRWRHKPRANMS